MPDVTGWSEEEILDYENGLAAQESLSSPRQDAYLDAYRVAAMRAIDEGLGSQWLRDEEHRLRHMTVPCLIDYSTHGTRSSVSSPEMSASTSDGLDLALAYGEALLDDVAVRYPGVGLSSDGESQVEVVVASDTDEAVTDDDGLVLAAAFDVFLERALETEGELAETGHSVGAACRYDFVSIVDRDGHVHRGMCAVIDDGDGGRLTLDLDFPAVLDVVRSGGQRPLSDRVRVASYAVALLGDAVCLLGLGKTLRSDVVGLLGEAVRLLRSLVREARKEQSPDASGSADDIDDEARIDAAHGFSRVKGDGAQGGEPWRPPVDGAGKSTEEASDGSVGIDRRALPAGRCSR